MKITVTVKANAKREKVEEAAEGEYRVSVKAPPREGRANEAVIKALAAHFGVPQSRITLVAGQTGKRKVVAIETCR